jgi:protein dithiol oxidoreductase (disulfide-forming)
MPISRRRVLGLAAGSLAAAGYAHGQAPQPRSFEDSFRAIRPQPTATGDNIEVIDFFWYGCPYCYQLLPLFNSWEKSKPADVAVRRIPAILRQEWVPDAHLYYTLETLGEADRLHNAVFESIHRDRLVITDIEAWARWAEANGIARAKWVEAYNWQGVREKVVRAVDIARDYDVRGTPAIIVDGRYQTGSGLAGSLQNVIPTLDGLLKLARERRKQPAPG